MSNRQEKGSQNEHLKRLFAETFARNFTEGYAESSAQCV